MSRLDPKNSSGETLLEVYQLTVDGPSFLNGAVTIGTSTSNANTIMNGNLLVTGTINGGGLVGGVTAVTASAPINSTGGAVPNISISSGTNGQVLTTVFGVPAWATPASGGVTSVTGSGNIASSGGLTPNITFTGTLATANGGTGLNTVGSNGQVLTISSGIPAWVTPASGGVTSVTGSGNIASSGGSTPNITFTGTLATANGGTGLNTVGSNGQVLTVVTGVPTWATPTAPVTSVTGSGNIASSGGLTPNITFTGTLATTNGGTGLNTVGSNGQILTITAGIPAWVTPASIATFSRNSAVGPALIVTDTNPINSDNPIATFYSSTGNGATVKMGTSDTDNVRFKYNGGVFTMEVVPYTGPAPFTAAQLFINSNGSVNGPRAFECEEFHLYRSGAPNYRDRSIFSTTDYGLVFTAEGNPNSNLGSFKFTNSDNTAQYLTLNNLVGGFELYASTPTTPAALQGVVTLQGSLTTSTSLGGTGNLTIAGTTTLSALTASTILTLDASKNIVSTATLPTTRGGTGLATVGTNGQVLTVTAGAPAWATPASGGVTSVTGSGNIASSGGLTPNITFTGTLATANGGTGLATVGTNGQVLTIVTGVPAWATPASGGVTSVTASSPLASSGGTTPNITISTTTGSGSTVVLATGPTISNPIITGNMKRIQSGTAAAANNGTVTFNTTFANTPSVHVTPLSNLGGVVATQVTSVSTTQFTWICYQTVGLNTQPSSQQQMWIATDFT